MNNKFSLFGPTMMGLLMSVIGIDWFMRDAIGGRSVTDDPRPNEQESRLR